MSAVQLQWYHYTIAGLFLVTAGITLMQVVGPGVLSIGVAATGCLLNLVAVLKSMQDGDPGRVRRGGREGEGSRRTR